MLAMISTHRPIECQASRYRHGCDPPRTIQAAPSSEPRNERPISPASTQSLIRLIELQPSLLDPVFRFPSKERK
jgi:hypothetical protein